MKGSENTGSKKCHDQEMGNIESLYGAIYASAFDDKVLSEICGKISLPCCFDVGGCSRLDNWDLPGKRNKCH